MERHTTNAMTIERKGIFDCSHLSLSNFSDIFSKNSFFGKDVKKKKVYSFTAKSGRNVPQIILQGNWAEQWGFEIGCSVSVECYQNKLVILKD